MGFVHEKLVMAAQFYKFMEHNASPQPSQFITKCHKMSHFVMMVWGSSDPGMHLGTVLASGPVTWLRQNIIQYFLLIFNFNLI